MAVISITSNQDISSAPESEPGLQLATKITPCSLVPSLRGDTPDFQGCTPSLLSLPPITACAFIVIAAGNDRNASI